MIVAMLLGAWGTGAFAQESPAVQAAVADARRIAARQCEHALIMGRINVTQPGTPERTGAERELAEVVDRARRESARDDQYRANRDKLGNIDLGVVETAYRNGLGACGKR